MSNKEKFKALVSEEKTNTIEKNTARIKSRAMLREAQGIALKVLDRLDDLKWSQRELARQMGVSPQQITKIVSGKENLTIATQTKLQELLDIPILASYFEKSREEQVSKEFKTKLRYVIQGATILEETKSLAQDAFHVELQYNAESKMYSYKEAV